MTITIPCLGKKTSLILVFGAIFFLSSCTPLSTSRVSPTLSKLNAVNLTVNQLITYKAEPPLGSNWQSYEETLLILTGDCEDYAILKAHYLKEFPKKTIVVVWTREEGYAHAVLEVTLGNQKFYLDNRFDYVLNQDQFISNYIPIYRTQRGL